jgi:hypothetical protein
VHPGNYRVECHAAKGGPKKFFLVKDLKVGGKNTKVRKLIGSGVLPPSEEIEKLSRKLALEIETEAIEKAALLEQ